MSLMGPSLGLPGVRFAFTVDAAQEMPASSIWTPSCCSDALIWQDALLALHALGDIMIGAVCIKCTACSKCTSSKHEAEGTAAHDQHPGTILGNQEIGHYGHADQYSCG